MVPIAVVLSLGCLVSVVLGRTSVSIEGGDRVEVGDNVNIICLCTGDSKCFSHGAVFRIGGRDYTHSQLDGSIPQYSIRFGAADYQNAKVILTLTQATLDNDGTTYECKIYPDNWDQANMVTLSVIEHGSVQNSSQTTVATNIMVTTTTSTTVVTSTTTTTTTTAITATPHTPVNSVPLTMPPETEGPTLKSNPEKATEPVKEHGSLKNSSQTTVATNIMVTTTTSTKIVKFSTTAKTKVTTSATPVTSAPSTETVGLKLNSQKVTEPVKEDDAPTYVYVAVGSGVGIVVYILTIVLIGLVISLKIKAKKAARRGSGISSSSENERENEYPVSIPMVSNPVYSEVVSPSAPAPPYFKVDPCQFGDRQIVVNMDTRYHDAPQRKSVAAESLYDYIDMQ